MCALNHPDEHNQLTFQEMKHVSHFFTSGFEPKRCDKLYLDFLFSRKIRFGKIPKKYHPVIPDQNCQMVQSDHANRCAVLSGKRVEHVPDFYPEISLFNSYGINRIAFGLFSRCLGMPQNHTIWRNLGNSGYSDL